MFTVEGIYLLQTVYCGRHIFSRMFTVEGIYILQNVYCGRHIFSRTFTVEGISSPEYLLWKARLLQNAYCRRRNFSRMLTVEGVTSPECLARKAYILPSRFQTVILIPASEFSLYHFDCLFFLSLWLSTFSTSCDWKTSSMSAPSVVQLSASWNIINMDSHYLQAWEFQPEISAWNPQDIHTLHLLLPANLPVPPMQTEIILYLNCPYQWVYSRLVRQASFLI